MLTTARNWSSNGSRAWPTSITSASTWSGVQTKSPARTEYELATGTEATPIGFAMHDRIKWQMLAEMACAGRQWCDFVSFDPRLPKKFQLFIRRVQRDETMIADMELGVEKFLEEVDKAMMRLEACSPLTDDLTGILSATAQQVQSPDAAT